MPSVRGVVEITHKDKTIELRLPMSRLEKLESVLGIGIPKLLDNARANEVSITQAITVIVIAAGMSTGKRGRKENFPRGKVRSWAEDNGIQEMFSVVTNLFSVTFASGDGSEDTGKQ